MTIEEVARHFAALTVDRPDRFDAMAEAVYAFQQAHNTLYSRYCKTQKYLPVAAFKHVPVTCFPHEEAECVFESSGTGRASRSKHYVKHLAVYERSVAAHFEAVFGQGPFTLIAHLPHYIDNATRSSLLYMVDFLIRRYGDDRSGFFLKDRTVLEYAITHSQAEGTPFLLFGAAFGLLDLIEEAPMPLPATARVIETGGMKTYRRAIDRDELHHRLAVGFDVREPQIWSEYGMCELMSQAYTRGGPLFFPPPWMRVCIVDPEHPDREMPEGEPGALAVIDLANLYSVSAILTEDRAVRRGTGFEVLGRLTQAELRGCNFLLEQR